MNYSELKQAFQDLKSKSPMENLTAHIIFRDVKAIPDYARTAQVDGTVCYYFGDTCIRVRESYEKDKICLEPVAGDQIVCGEWVELPIDRVYGYSTLLERYLNQEVEP